MAARHDSGLDAFGHPGAHDEISNLSFHAHQISRADPEFHRVAGVQPKRIRVRNLIQPLRIGTARVNLNRQTKSGNQDCLIGFEIVGVNVTLDVSRNRVFMPSPLCECLGKEFQAAARGWKSALDLTVDFHAGESPAIFIAVGAGDRHDVRRCGFRGPSEYAAKMIFANILELFAGYVLFVDCANLLRDLKRAIAAHVFQWLQFFSGVFLDSTNCRMPKEPSRSIRHVSSIQNSFSSQTSPGFTSRVSLMSSPSRWRAARITGCRKPSHCESCVSYE